MPKLDGFEVLQRVRENKSEKKWQPVIIVSGRSELHDIQKSYSLQADHYISKPCNMNDILQAITLMVNLISRQNTDDQNKEESN